MMIKVVRGYYGYRNGRIVEMKDASKPAFEVTDEEAKRIIGLGIAKAVSVSESDEQSIKSDKNVLSNSTTEQYLQGLQYSELKQLCKKMNVSGAGKKEELIQRLLESETETQDDENEEEMEEDDLDVNFPTLQPAEPEE